VYRSPRLIAFWDGVDGGWQPASAGPGEHGLALGPLITAVQAPAAAAGLSTRRPEIRVVVEVVEDPVPLDDLERWRRPIK
jgi:hypothetical protein